MSKHKEIKNNSVIYTHAKNDKKTELSVIAYFSTYCSLCSLDAHWYW
jgi:hypothetical protein